MEKKRFIGSLAVGLFLSFLTKGVICSDLPDKRLPLTDLQFVAFKQLHCLEESDGANLNTCAICQKKLKKRDLLLQHSCLSHKKNFHCFHYNCLKPWLEKHRDCPLCRRLISNINEFRSSCESEPRFFKRIFRNFFSFLSTYSEMVNYAWRFEFNEDEYLRCLEHDGLNCL